MATGLRLEDRLDGTGNFVPWKARILLLLEEHELWPDVVRNTTTYPIVIPTDATVLAAFNKKDCKARRIILDAVKDHIIPHISGKDKAHGAEILSCTYTQKICSIQIFVCTCFCQCYFC